MAVSTEDIKLLRERTGAGIMDCKNALIKAENNIDKAVEILREAGIAKAAKKANRIAAEGLVHSYIHMGGKIGVLVEVNCETDFVAKSEPFVELVKDIALQIAASNPEYVSREQVPAERVEKEREILKAQAQNEGKPAQVIERMLEGRMNKFYQEICLLEQTFIKNPDVTIQQLVNNAILNIGEKITVRRFVRYEMGEGLEKRNDNFAEEVMSQIKK
ncbi:MAG: translation elongation factor Ts [Christensenellales bacterium]